MPGKEATYLLLKEQRQRDGDVFYDGHVPTKCPKDMPIFEERINNSGQNSRLSGHVRWEGTPPIKGKTIIFEMNFLKIL